MIISTCLLLYWIYNSICVRSNIYEQYVFAGKDTVLSSDALSVLFEPHLILFKAQKSRQLSEFIQPLFLPILNMLYSREITDYVAATLCSPKTQSSDDAALAANHCFTIYHKKILAVQQKLPRSTQQTRAYYKLRLEQQRVEDVLLQIPQVKDANDPYDNVVRKVFDERICIRKGFEYRDVIEYSLRCAIANTSKRLNLF